MALRGRDHPARREISWLTDIAASPSSGKFSGIRRLSEYIRAGTRITSSECIICQTCTSVCPHHVLKVTIGFAVNRKDHLRRKVV